MSKISYEEMKNALRIQRYKEIAEYDKVIKRGTDSMWQELCAKVTTPDVDPTDIFDEELADIFYFVLRFAQMNNIDLSTSVTKKI